MREGWDIDSVHIVVDRMIAHSHDKVRIYQRVGRLTRLAKKLRGALLCASPHRLRRLCHRSHRGEVVATYIGQRGDQYRSDDEAI